ncbi:MAG: hypothetical protein JJT90_15715 [Ectothiorhodospiraceae bacterium]|nr:hypothetical protein [Ectothiorhodospiraceae bacterium]
MGGDRFNLGVDILDFCVDYCQTVDSNIRQFLRDKTWKMNFRLETAESDFSRFWDLIGADGDLGRALEEWRVQYNASP